MFLSVSLLLFSQPDMCQEESQNNLTLTKQLLPKLFEFFVFLWTITHHLGDMQNLIRVISLLALK